VYHHLLNGKCPDFGLRELGKESLEAGFLDRTGAPSVIPFEKDYAYD